MRLFLVAVALGVGAACASLPADERAADALVSDDDVDVARTDDGLIAFLPVLPRTEVAVAFYPGGLVDETAYAPLLHRLAAAGVPGVIVPMPSDLAVLAPRRADRAVEAFPELGPWVAAGHSLGGAMACTWADRRRDDLAGVALLAAYPAKAVDLSELAVPVVSLRGTEDGVLDLETWEARKGNLPADTRYVVVEGANHAGFGAYGPQDGDGEATIPAEDQWDLAVAEIAALALGGE